MTSCEAESGWVAGVPRLKIRTALSDVCWAEEFPEGRSVFNISIGLSLQQAAIVTR